MDRADDREIVLVGRADIDLAKSPMEDPPPTYLYPVRPSMVTRTKVPVSVP